MAPNMAIPRPLITYQSTLRPTMSKRSVNNNSDISPAAQSASKQRHTSTPAFRVARGPSSSGTVVKCNSQLTTIRKNAHGWHGYLTESQSLLSDPDPLSSPSVNEGLSSKAVSDLSLLDLGQLNDDPQAFVPPKPPKPKRNWQNTMLVCVLTLTYLIYSKNNQTKLQEWLVFQQSCLDELLQHDGLGDTLGQELCISCKKTHGVYKCKDCFSGSLLRCRDCLVNAHQDHPLHCVEVRLQFFHSICYV